MRMGKDHKPEVRSEFEQRTGIPGLRCGRSVEHRGISRVVREPPGQAVGDPKPEVGMERPKHSSRQRVPRDAMHRGGGPVLLGHTIAVRDERSAPRDVHLRAARVKRDPEILRQEVPAPAIVVAPDQGDRNVAGPESVELRKALEMAARDDPSILEPKIEQVAVDEEGVPEIGHCVEEAVEGRLHRRRSLAQVGIGHDDHA